MRRILALGIRVDLAPTANTGFDQKVDLSEDFLIIR
jgi:hypothetical protein